MSKKKKDRKWVILSCIVGLFFFVGAAFLEFCHDDAKASPPGVWVCVAEAKNPDKPKYSCEATGRSLSKKKAKEKAVGNCDVKCDTEAKCVVTACARRR